MSTTTPTTSAATATATCVDNIKPGKNGYLPPESCDVVLPYVPSFAAAVLFSVLFGLTFLAHIIQAYIFRKRFCWVVIMGALWEVITMVLRALLTRHQNQVGYYTPSFLLMLLAPLWINAFLYMILGRMIYFFVDDKKLVGISAIRLAALFVTLDILAFIVQASGGSMASMDDAPDHILKIGLDVYMGGVGLQEMFILGFTALAVLLHRRMIQTESTQLGWEARTPRQGMPWRWMFYAMYATLVLISIRNIFRLVEYSRGFESSNPILRHEAYQYALDSMLMFFALVILNVFHPGRLLVGPGSEFPKLSRAEKKQAKRETKERKAARKAERKLNGEYQQGGASDDTIYLGAIDPVRYQQVGNFSSRFSEDVATTYEPLQRV